MTTESCRELARLAERDQGPEIRLLTALAETADLPDAAYRAIFDRLAVGRSLRGIATALHSAVSYGWWAEYAKELKPLDRARKAELRTWAGLPPLPPTVVETVQAHTHADAAVYQVGTQVASRVLLIGADVPEAALQVNGDCRLLASAPAEDPPEICNGRYKQYSYKSLAVRRKTWEKLNAARELAGLTWDAFLAGLA